MFRVSMIGAMAAMLLTPLFASAAHNAMDGAIEGGLRGAVIGGVVGGIAGLVAWGAKKNKK